MKFLGRGFQTTTFIGLWQPEGWISNIDIHTKNREKHEGESVTVTDNSKVHMV